MKLLSFLGAVGVTAFGASAHAQDLNGPWTSPLGPLTVAQKSDRVVGSGKGSCGAPESGHLLEGDMLEDSLSGQIYVCLQGCDKGPSWVPVLLLVGADGKSLSGTSTLPKGCKALGPNGSLVLKKQTGSASAVANPKLAGDLTATPKPPAQTPPPTPAPTPEETQVETPPEVATKAPKPKKKPHPDTIAAADPTPAPQTPPPAQPSKDHEGREAPAARAKAMELARDGAAFQQEGKFEQARHRFQQAIDIDPFYAEGFNGVGITYYARNDYTDALRWYKKALGADPSFGDAYYNMACVYALQKHKALALRYLRVAFHNGFTSHDVMHDDPDLAGLHGDPAFEALLGEAQ